MIIHLMIIGSNKLFCASGETNTVTDWMPQMESSCISRDSPQYTCTWLRCDCENCAVLVWEVNKRCPATSSKAASHVLSLRARTAQLLTAVLPARAPPQAEYIIAVGTGATAPRSPFGVGAGVRTQACLGPRPGCEKSKRNGEHSCCRGCDAWSLHHGAA
jgi:hypothetical protein